MCGGHLEIDVDRQVYFYPYCGVTFDYDYFRKDNALDLARKALKRNEFGAAKDAFDYMLTKAPAREKLEVLNSKYDELSEETKKYIREHKQMAIKIVSTYKIADDE